MQTSNATQTKPIFTLTTEASTQIKSMIANEPENAGKTLRVYAEGGGCSEAKYNLFFDKKRVNDIVDEFDGALVLMDAFSASFLKGAVISYSDGFKISNLNTKSSCGCSESFKA